jgi:hypothetical protein
VSAQKLNNFTRAPDYIAYLAYIISSATNEEGQIRTIAGYLLKNNARLIIRAPPEVVVYVKHAVLHAFNDSQGMIRTAAAQDIVAFLGILEPRGWPECLMQLVGLLDSHHEDQQEVSARPSVSVSPFPRPFPRRRVQTRRSRPSLSRAASCNPARATARRGPHRAFPPGAIALHRALGAGMPSHTPGARSRCVRGTGIVRGARARLSFHLL